MNKYDIIELTLPELQNYPGKIIQIINVQRWRGNCIIQEIYKCLVEKRKSQYQRTNRMENLNKEIRTND